MTHARFVTVDSRDREDPNQTPGSYSVRLLEDVRDVSMIKVRSMDIPPMWNIPYGRSILWVSVGGGDLGQVVIAPGQYSPIGAATALEDALNAQVAALTWTVTVTDDGRFKVSANGSFGIAGGDRTHDDGYGSTACGRVLGFAYALQLSNGSNELVGRYRHQLDRLETMYLHVEDFDAVHGSKSGLHNCLEVINPSGIDHEISAEKYFHPPLSRVNRLKIRIVDYYGNTVDFDNREHRIDFLMQTGDAKHRVGPGYAPY